MARPGDAALLALVRRVAARMLGEGRMLATAESCTGGLIAKCVTDLPGSSAWFERGWVTYTDRAKQEELGVPAAMLKRHGAVSEPVARAMVRGVLRESVADLAVGVTGIAGPDGGSAEKPVGTVWIAWAWRDGRRVWVVARPFLFGGDRDAVRRQTAAEALKGLVG
jgi:nicotinamide-nucleotide amidase